MTLFNVLITIDSCHFDICFSGYITNKMYVHKISSIDGQFYSTLDPSAKCYQVAFRLIYN